MSDAERSLPSGYARVLAAVEEELEALDRYAQSMENTCLHPPCSHSIGFRESVRRIREVIEHALDSGESRPAP